MKKLLPLMGFVLLSFGCQTRPYYCIPANIKDSFRDSDAICIANEDMDYIEQNNYTNQKFSDFLRFAVSDSSITRSKCSQDRNSFMDGGVLVDGYYAYPDGTKLSEYTYAYVCEVGTAPLYDKFLQETEIKRQQSIQLAKAQQDKFSELERTLGCKNMFSLKYPYRIMQQLSTGSLITVDSTYARDASIFGIPDIYFVESNDADMSKVDDEYIDSGYFQEIGVYKYNTPLRTVKTVKKLKRCSSKTL